MNLQTTIGRRPPIKITSASFWWLRNRPTFSGFVKRELIKGELLGVPLGDDGEPISDASVTVKLLADDYQLLCDTGAFAEYGRTELIDGKVFEVSPQYRRHGIVKMDLYDALRDALRANGSPFRPVIEFSLALSPVSLPEPDILLTSEPVGDGPVPLASVALVVEVASSTLAEDMGTMAGLYAAAGIPENWVADVEGKVIHQLWAPEGETYAQRREVAFGERIEAVTVAGLTVTSAAL